jgi:hypothetical protein
MPTDPFEPPKELNQLHQAISDACTAQSLPVIERGRAAVLAMPREWVLSNIEQAADAALDLTDEWEYRRLLELLLLIDDALARKLIDRGLASLKAEIRESAADFCT